MVSLNPEPWLPEAGRRGWAVLTKDDRIRYRQVDMAAASTAGVARTSVTSPSSCLLATSLADQPSRARREGTLPSAAQDNAAAEPTEA